MNKPTGGAKYLAASIFRQIPAEQVFNSAVEYMSSKRIDTDNAPGAIGPYSQAMVFKDLIFTSGQLPLDPATQKIPGDIREQARNSLGNVRAILESAGSGLDKVLKTTVYLTDMSDFLAVNEVYASFFVEPFPARSCLAVKTLPLGARVEIEAVAFL